MTSIPPVPPSIASAAGAIGSRDSQPSAAERSASAGAQPTSIEASAEGGDRDADGRDLREHQRRAEQEILDEALDEAAGSDQRGGLDVSV